MGVHVGFTGTRHGMTPPQLRRLYAELRGQKDNGALWFHHGDCVGADAESHVLARLVGLGVMGHPPVDDSRRAFCRFDSVAAPLPFLERNAEIVQCAGVTGRMYACPAEMVEQERGGTWWTVRYARKISTSLTIIFPDGSTSE